MEQERSNLHQSIEREIASADLLAREGSYAAAFHHLERAHVLGQASTYHRTRVHWRMLKLAIRLRSPKEIWGQIVRIVGASTKTPFGIYPTGNTGGSDVWFFKSMPVPDDLSRILNGENPEHIKPKP